MEVRGERRAMGEFPPLLLPRPMVTSELQLVAERATDSRSFA